MEPLYSNGKRILRPSEFERFVNLFKAVDVILINALLYSGMRYRELIFLHSHPKNFDEKTKCVFVQSTKKKARQRERYVSLNQQGATAIKLFLALDEVPSCHTFWLKIKRKIKSEDEKFKKGLTCKTFRATWESWLSYKYKTRHFEIICSMGHNSVTALQHYIQFRPYEGEEELLMEKYTSGW